MLLPRCWGLCFGNSPSCSRLAFLLAWIPPVRRLFAWLLDRRFLVLGCLVTLVALFYTVENWRGRRAWQAYKRDRETRGERFDLAGLALAAVPKDQNFFETPLWQDMHSVYTNGINVWSDKNWGNRVIFDAFGPNSSKAPGTGNWMKAERVDLAAWQAFYRGTNNSFPTYVAPTNVSKGYDPAEAFRRRYGLHRAAVQYGVMGMLYPGYMTGPPTNYFPICKEPQTPAADVLLALTRFDGNRQLLIEAAARPQARFWVNYYAGAGALLPHLARVKGSASYLSVHAMAALQSGDRATALQDVQLIFRLIESVRGEPVVISHLVRAAMLQVGLQPIWEGLADRQWAEADLTIIESELGKLDFLADYHLALRGERACGLWVTDYIRREGVQALEEMTHLQGETAAQGQTAGFPDWEKVLRRALFRLVPGGWFGLGTGSGL